MPQNLIPRRSFALLTLLTPVAAHAQRRRRVVVTHNRTRVVVRPGHPIARAVNRTVVVRAPRRAVVVGAPLVFLPAIAFTAAVVAVSMPAREQLIWQDSETINRDEEWVESNFGVDERGTALYLDISGRAELDFADVIFDNGQVQVIDFHERPYRSGLHQLLDFPGRRHVKTVRLVAKSKSDHTTLRVFLSR